MHILLFLKYVRESLRETKKDITSIISHEIYHSIKNIETELEKSGLEGLVEENEIRTKLEDLIKNFKNIQNVIKTNTKVIQDLELKIENICSKSECDYFHLPHDDKEK
jgi:hypothetical protein